MERIGLHGEQQFGSHLDPRAGAGHSSAQNANLTAFERRALELFASGLPRAEIAAVLNRAPKTISNSLTTARDKLGARSLAEAAVVLANALTGYQST